MKKITRTIAVAGCMLLSTGGFAREIATSSPNPPHGQPAKLTAVCAQTTAIKDLNINNVRARILVGGDMWWDQGLGVAQYEVPVGSSKNSLYAGAIWVGGLDAGNNIKTACQTYRQTNTVGCTGGGNEFFSGPIDKVNFTITPERCTQFDRHWKLRKQDILKYIDNPNFDAVTADEIESKQNILSWPGNGLPNEEHFLAPFADLNGDGVYDPNAGEYPRYLVPRPDLNPPYDPDYPISPNAPKTICNDYLFGDQTIWWVFNDVGGIKYETNSPPIGLEIRAQAFGFKTNDEINNMTFYKYQIINQSSSVFKETYFGQWVDADLGYYLDDYVRCNVKLGVGFTYNGDAVDDLPDGYGSTPPAIGLDFFQGPVADVGDTLDNDRDGCFNCTYFIDPTTHDTTTVQDSVFPESIIMSKFVYFNNNSDPVNGNPCGAQEHYNYLKGIWRNGVRMTYGGNGTSVSTDFCDFMYPGNTDPDPVHAANPWTEETAGNTPDDRRMLQSAGPFTLQPGAVNYITVGAVWARALSGNNLASLPLVEQADVKAQALFDNCFKTLDGPDAPDLVIRELDKELVFSLQNTNNDNVEQYDKADPTIVDSAAVTDKKNTFRFQGFQVYQLKKSTGNIADLVNNPDDIKLIFQCDIKDTITQIINYAIAPNNVYTATIQVSDTANKGLRHTYKIDKDLFATTNSALINHKNYYYTAISYAYNNYKVFDPQNPLLGGQLKPYLAGRNNIKVYNAIPHFIDPENGGTVLNSNYGDGPSIKRIEGQGNGGMILDFTQSTVDEILSSGRSLHPQYVNGRGPIDVKVYDPVLVQNRDFTNRFNGVADDSRWTMTEHGSGISVIQDTTINVYYEQVLATDHKQKGPDGKDLVLDWGLTTNIHTVVEAGKWGSLNNGFLEGTISYSDNSARWLNFLANVPDDQFENWIRSTLTLKDTLKVYENVIGGTWGPLELCANAAPPGSTIVDSLMPKPPTAWLNDPEITLSPSPSGSPSKTGLASVDIVFTSDRSKWSRAAVIEMGHTRAATLNNAYRFDLRKSPSIDKSGNMNYPSTDNDDAPTGMGWFPGYAVNLETGERLNIVYGENSCPRKCLGVEIVKAVGNGSEITYTTVTPHKYALGETVFIVGKMTPAAFGNVYGAITSIPNDTTFKIAVSTTGTSDVSHGISTAGVVRRNFDNGADMQWNPTATVKDELFGYPVFGGMHYIYVFGHNFLDGSNIPLYDKCKYIHDKLFDADATSNNNLRKAIWKEGMWVSIPMLAKGKSLYQTDVTVRLRVAKTYRAYNTNVDESTYLNGSGTLVSGTQYYVVSGTAVYNTVSYAAGSTFTAQDPVLSFSGGVIAPTQNGGNPLYDFNTNDLAAILGNSEAAKDALKLVNVVPNPYYAYSAYEGTTGVAGQLDNRIKIVNLPPKCTISVFTLHGTLVKRFIRDVPSDNSFGNDISTGNSETSIDWDLKNTDGIGIASGIYLIHVDAGELGKRTLKWFGVMRPIDVGVY